MMMIGNDGHTPGDRVSGQGDRPRKVPLSATRMDKIGALRTLRADLLRRGDRRHQSFKENISRLGNLLCDKTAAIPFLVSGKEERIEDSLSKRMTQGDFHAFAVSEAMNGFELGSKRKEGGVESVKRVTPCKQYFSNTEVCAQNTINQGLEYRSQVPTEDVGKFHSKVDGSRPATDRLDPALERMIAINHLQREAIDFTKDSQKCSQKNFASSNYNSIPINQPRIPFSELKEPTTIAATTTKPVQEQAYTSVHSSEQCHSSRHHPRPLRTLSGHLAPLLQPCPVDARGDAQYNYYQEEVPEVDEEDRSLSNYLAVRMGDRPEDRGINFSECPSSRLEVAAKESLGRLSERCSQRRLEMAFREAAGVVAPAGEFDFSAIDHAHLSVDRDQQGSWQQSVQEMMALVNNRLSSNGVAPGATNQLNDLFSADSLGANSLTSHMDHPPAVTPLMRVDNSFHCGIESSANRARGGSNSHTKKSRKDAVGSSHRSAGSHKVCLTASMKKISPSRAEREVEILEFMACSPMKESVRPSFVNISVCQATYISQSCHHTRPPLPPHPAPSTYSPTKTTFNLCLSRRQSTPDPSPPVHSTDRRLEGEFAQISVHADRVKGSLSKSVRKAIDRAMISSQKFEDMQELMDLRAELMGLDATIPALSSSRYQTGRMQDIDIDRLDCRLRMMEDMQSTQRYHIADMLTEEEQDYARTKNIVLDASMSKVDFYDACVQTSYGDRLDRAARVAHAKEYSHQVLEDTLYSPVHSDEEKGTLCIQTFANPTILADYSSKQSNGEAFRQRYSTALKEIEEMPFHLLRVGRNIDPKDTIRDNRFMGMFARLIMAEGMINTVRRRLLVNEQFDLGRLVNTLFAKVRTSDKFKEPVLHRSRVFSLIKAVGSSITKDKFEEFWVRRFNKTVMTKRRFVSELFCRRDHMIPELSPVVDFKEYSDDVKSLLCDFFELLLFTEKIFQQFKGQVTLMDAVEFVKRITKDKREHMLFIDIVENGWFKGIPPEDILPVFRRFTITDYNQRVNAYNICVLLS
jgi:hypothetical protein